MNIRGNLGSVPAVWIAGSGVPGPRVETPRPPDLLPADKEMDGNGSEQASKKGEEGMFAMKRKTWQAVKAAQLSPRSVNALLSAVFAAAFGRGALQPLDKRSAGLAILLLEANAMGQETGDGRPKDAFLITPPMWQAVQDAELSPRDLVTLFDALFGGDAGAVENLGKRTKGLARLLQEIHRLGGETQAETEVAV